MLVRELPGNWRHSLLSQSPIWNRPVESLTRLDLSAFLRRHMGTARHLTARKQVETLIDATWTAVLDGKLSPIPEICYFSAPVERLTFGELRQWLARTTPERGQAILFALEMKLSVPEAIDLTWRSVNAMALTPFADAIAKKTIRHFRLPYLFWEVLPHGAAAPLIGLQDSVRDVTEGRGFEALQALYASIIPIDTDADLNDFRGHVDLDIQDLPLADSTLH